METGSSRLLDIPYDIREKIFKYLLPSDPIVKYQCPYGIIGSAHDGNHFRKLCGQGPGWRCLRERKHRPLDILRVCRIVYDECFRLLWDRTFELEVERRAFHFIDHRYEAFRWLPAFPWSRMRAVHLKINLPVVSTDETRDISHANSELGQGLLAAGKLRRMDIEFCSANTQEEYKDAYTAFFREVIMPFMSLKRLGRVEDLRLRWQRDVDGRVLESPWHMVFDDFSERDGPAEKDYPASMVGAPFGQGDELLEEGVSRCLSRLKQDFQKLDLHGKDTASSETVVIIPTVEI